MIESIEQIFLQYSVKTLGNAKKLLGKNIIDFFKRLLFRDFEESDYDFFSKKPKQTEILNKVILLFEDYLEFNHTNTVDEIQETFSVNEDENKIEYFEFDNVSEIEEHFFPESISKSQNSYKVNALLFVVSAKNYDEGLKDAKKVMDEIGSCLSGEATVLFGIKEDEKGKMPKIRMLAGLDPRL